MTQKRSAKDRTAAEWKSVAKATRRRRRILQAGFFFSREELTRITRQVTRTFDLNNPVGSVYSNLNKFRIFIVIQLYIHLIKDVNALLIYYLTTIFKKVIYK